VRDGHEIPNEGASEKLIDFGESNLVAVIELEKKEKPRREDSFRGGANHRRRKPIFVRSIPGRWVEKRR